MKIEKNHLIIGIGGTGGNVLKAMRKRYFQEISSDERSNTPVGFMYVDSSDEEMKPNDPTWKVLGENSQIGKNNFLYVRAANLGDQLKNVSSYPGVKSWLGNKSIWENLVGVVASDGAAAQRRRLGRFLYACAVNEYEDILKKEAKSLTDKSGNTEITFHIIAGLAGGTGSGSVVDIIAQTRKMFKPANGIQYKILVYCMIPESMPLPNWDKGFYHANGYAALMELNALNVKRFIPHDVSGEYERMDFEGIDNVFDTCFLFTNTNENGFQVHTKDQLPHILSDLIFHFMSLTNSGGLMRNFQDAYTGENILDERFEFNEIADTQETANKEKPVRTRKFNSFGIKRIVSPEEEIVDYFTYSFTRQALLQFRYNNWSDDLGFRDQPKNEEYITHVTSKETLMSWSLSDDHLSLCFPILESEKVQNWKNFKDDWNAIIPNLSNLAWEKNESRALNELTNFCEDRFNNKFRKIGITEFYKIKEQAKIDHAREITEIIGRSLFDQWKTGDKSIYEITRLLDTLIEQTEIRYNALDGKIVKKREDVDRALADKTVLEKEWAKVGTLGDLLGKRKKIYQAYTTHLQSLYIHKTILEGLVFSKKLLAEVLNQLRLLNTEIKRFSDTLSKAIINTEKSIKTRCQDERISEQSFRETIVKYYDSAAVKEFTERATKNHKVQKEQAGEVRNAIADLAGSEKSFVALNENVSGDKLMDIFTQKTRESSIRAHNELIENKSQRIIGVNIVEKLKEQYGSTDQQTELNDFARNVMKSSGVFLSFDKAQTTMQLRNNKPSQPGKLTMLETTLISIPESSETEFVKKLVAAFESNSNSTRKLYFDTTSQRKNEITIINLISGFSIRMIGNVKALKAKYDLQINGANPEVAQLVLHLEGDGSQYPPLYAFSIEESENLLQQQQEAQEAQRQSVLDKEEEANQIITYTLLACVLDVIKHQDRMDGTGKKAYSIMRLDDMGLPDAPLILGDNFLTIANNPDLNPQFLVDTRKSVNVLLANEYLHVTKRTELETKIKELIGTTILAECKGNPGDPIFVKYKKAAVTAIKILQN